MERSVKILGTIFVDRNQNIVPLQRQNENGAKPPHAEKLPPTCTRKNCRTRPQNEVRNGGNERLVKLLNKPLKNKF